MAQTEKGIIYPFDYNEVADVPADFKALAESIDRILSDYSLNTDSGNKIVLEMNNTTYKIKAVLKDKDDNVIDTSNEIDLPLENMVTNISYNNQILTLTYQDGQTTEVSIADLISDLASKEEVTELQSQIDDLTTLVETELESNEVEGTEIDVSDSAEYRGKIEVKGNTYQKQLSGKNLFNHYSYPNNNTSNGVTITNNRDGSFTLNGTCTQNNTIFNLGQTEDIKKYVNEGAVTQTAYYISGSCTKGQSSSSARTIIRLNYDTGTNKMIPLENLKTESIISKINPQDDRTTSWSWGIVLGEGDSFNNFTIKYQVEKGSVGTDWEEFCEGQASPNTDYPQEIKVVTGDNVVKHVGKNLLNMSNSITNHGIITSLKKDGSINIKGTTDTGWFNMTVNSGKRTKIRLLPGKYTVSVNEALNFSLRIRAFYKNYPEEYFHITINPGETSGTFTVPRECDNFHIYASGLATGTVIDLNIKLQLEEGTTTTPYEPYREEEYKLDLWKENEFDSESATIVNALLNDAGFLHSNNYYRTAIISVLSNKTYKISKMAGRFFRVAEFASFPQLEDSYNNRIKDDKAEYITYKTAHSTNYLAITYWSSTDAIGETEMLDSIQIQEAIELCKIGDYEDISFKNVVGDENYNAELEDGAWYKKGVIGKQILNGTENWTTAINRNTYNKVAKQIQLQNAILNKGSISNLIVSQHFRSESADNIFDNNAIGINCAGISTAGYLRVGLELDKFSTDSSFKEWLAQNNDVVRFPVQTPTYEKISDPTLISQLEALRKAKWFKGINHWWTETENLEPNLKGTYKQSNNIKNKERDERLDNLESRLALLE